jgi:hypothetical protein
MTNVDLSTYCYVIGTYKNTRCYLTADHKWSPDRENRYVFCDRFSALNGLNNARLDAVSSYKFWPEFKWYEIIK